MLFDGALGHFGRSRTRVHTTAQVHFGPVEGGFAINKIDLRTEAEVPGISNDEFMKYAGQAKQGCPVSKALSATPITLEATLL